MPDDRIARIDEAERLLDEIGAQLLDGGPPGDELWPITVYNLASHARSHHRALLEGLAGKTPRAARIHGRPIVETAILIHYLADEPDLRTWLWVADGLKEQLKMIREWRTSVERGEADDASPEELEAIIANKEHQLSQVEAKAKGMLRGLARSWRGLSCLRFTSRPKATRTTQARRVLSPRIRPRAESRRPTNRTVARPLESRESGARPSSRYPGY